MTTTKRQRVRAHYQMRRGKRTRISGYSRYDNVMHVELWTVFQRIDKERMRIVGQLRAAQVVARTGQEAERLSGCDEIPPQRHVLKDAIRRRHVEGSLIVGVDDDGERCWAPKRLDRYATLRVDLPRQQSPAVDVVHQ